MFDARLLVAKYQKEEIAVPETIGFADSLRLFRTVYPGRQNYRLASLVHDIADVDFGAHDTSEDMILYNHSPKYRNSSNIMVDTLTIAMTLDALRIYRTNKSNTEGVDLKAWMPQK
ncbi:hypothetical protein MAR_022094 [Mya arenaria]|uniref:Uncharacterized protein n=1 Tax=Mya arenaria TaxID=6604 RepID=A0ABY7DL91_MYAAR|nr:hypothetical protein MAR_022094 [Mya arenaria]